MDGPLRAAAGVESGRGAHRAYTRPMTADDLARLRDVFARYPEVAGAWLFGSHARGGARPDSDVDLAVDPATPGARARKLDLLADLVGAGFEDVDLVVLDHDDPVLRWEAIGANRLVYAAPGYDAEGAFARALRQYDDTARLRAIQREAYYERWLRDDR